MTDDKEQHGKSAVAHVAHADAPKLEPRSEPKPKAEPAPVDTLPPLERAVRNAEVAVDKAVLELTEAKEAVVKAREREDHHPSAANNDAWHEATQAVEDATGVVANARAALDAARVAMT